MRLFVFLVISSHHSSLTWLGVSFPRFLVRDLGDSRLPPSGFVTGRSCASWIHPMPQGPFGFPFPSDRFCYSSTDSWLSSVLQSGAKAQSAPRSA
jgi:hypothetical protein